jgi:hypothetical protein
VPATVSITAAPVEVVMRARVPLALNSSECDGEPVRVSVGPVWVPQWEICSVVAKRTMPMYTALVLVVIVRRRMSRRR